MDNNTQELNSTNTSQVAGNLFENQNEENSVGYRKTGYISCRCIYCIVWCTKYRRKVLQNNDIARRLRELIFQHAGHEEIINIEIMPDHVILLVEERCPNYGIHQAICKLKAKTSSILRTEFRILKTSLPTLWTRHYYLSTVGEISNDSIKHYIQEQKFI